MMVTHEYRYTTQYYMQSEWTYNNISVLDVERIYISSRQTGIPLISYLRTIFIKLINKMWLRRSVSFAPLRLVKTIEKEVKYAQSLQRTYPILDDFLKKTGFVIMKNMHQCILTKQTGQHTVSVVFHARNPVTLPEPEPNYEEVIPMIEELKQQNQPKEEEIEIPDLSEFFIVISRDSREFVLECTTYNSLISMNSMFFTNSTPETYRDILLKDRKSYQLSYSILSPVLKRTLVDWIRRLGIPDEIGKFVEIYSLVMEEDQYQWWLQGISSVVNNEV